MVARQGAGRVLGVKEDFSSRPARGFATGPDVPQQPQSGSPAQFDCFRTTHWSVVLTARDEDSPHATEALECLCRSYWYPLYSHIRRRGHDHHAAQDLTQEFFARLLEKQWMDSVAPEKGRFRTFLLTAADHLLANEWRDARAAKRGGGQTMISLEETETGRERFAHEPVSDGTPEKRFDKAWAATVLDRALTRLQQELVARGKPAHFEEWKVFLPTRRPRRTVKPRPSAWG